MLKSLHVQHYKSLSDVHLELSPITVLVGPNGSGKSNIVDALRFTRDAIAHGLEHAISDRGGIDILRQYSPTRPYTLSFRIDFEYPLGKTDDLYSAHYSFRVAGSGTSYRVEAEDAHWSEQQLVIDEKGEEWMSHGVSSYQLRRDKSGKVFVNDDEQKRIVPADELAIRRAPAFEGFLEMSMMVPSRLARMHFASIYPNNLREPARPDTDRRLKENCSNWASIIKAMRGRRLGDAQLHRIIEYMKQVIPGLQQVTVKLIGGYLVPQFLVKETSRSKAHYFDPVQLSDGTLRLFAILLTLYQLPRQEFLALEEPELTIHPGLLELLAEAMREVSRRTQLLITTHSPHLLDHFDPAEIRVVFMQEGQTMVSNVRQSQVETVKQGLMSLSEVMAMDGLRPQLKQ